MRRLELLQSALLAAVLALTACGKKEEEAAPPPPPPPPKQEVKVESVDDVMKRLAIDSRVKMDESERPNTGDAAGDLKRLEATLLFFNAMVKGDATKLKPMLSDADQTTLDLMQKDGQWKRATERIDRVTVGCTGGQEPETFMALGIFMTDDRFDPQLWSVKSPGAAEQCTFSAVPTPPNVIDQLKGNKAEPRVQQWVKILKEQLEKSKLPDEVVTVAQQDRSIEGDSSSGGGDEPAAPSGPAPGGSPSGPGKRKGGGGPQAPGPKGPGGPGGPS